MCHIGLLVGFCILASASASKLYTLNQTETTGSFRLMTIPADGVPVPVSGAEIGFWPGSSTIDRDNGVLYFIGSTKPAFHMGNISLVGVSLTTGAVVSNAAIPVVPSTGPGRADLFEAAIEYASDLKAIVVLITDFTDSINSHVLGTIHPTTGEWSVIRAVSNPASASTQPAAAVYIPEKQIFIFQLGVNRILTLFAYNFKTVALVNTTGPQFTDFVFNPILGHVWGHGVTVKGSYIVRVLSKMDPSTLTVEVVKVLDSLAVDGGNLVTLDVEEQTMYWITSLSKDNNSSKPLPFYLVGVALDNATIVSQSLQCPSWAYAQDTPSKCPATLDSF